ATTTPGASSRSARAPTWKRPPRDNPVHSRPQARRLLMRHTVTGITFFVLLVAALSGTALAQGGTLRIGMTASDIPYTGGQADNGFEGLRFVGYQIYEPLINWDLTRSDRLATPTPGLAESWSVNKATPTLWTFKLRKGVTFHHGSPI